MLAKRKSKSINKQTNKNKITNKETNKQASRHTKQTNQPTNQPTKQPTKTSCIDIFMEEHVTRMYAVSSLIFGCAQCCEDNADVDLYVTK